MLQSRTNELVHEASSPLPPHSVLIIRRIFPFCGRKGNIFQLFFFGGGGGDGGCVIQLQDCSSKD